MEYAADDDLTAAEAPPQPSAVTLRGMGLRTRMAPPNFVRSALLEAIGSQDHDTGRGFGGALSEHNTTAATELRPVTGAFHGIPFRIRRTPLASALRYLFPTGQCCS